jgi:murein peptide amidase A
VKVRRPRRLSALISLGLAAAFLTAVAPGGPAAAIPLQATERVVIGHSVQGRPIVAFHRYTVGVRDGRSLLVIGQMHGDEETGKRVISALRDRTLPLGVDLWLIPTVNPDGDARNTRVNRRGVDLNRNFPWSWKKAGKGTRYFSGPRPASEPETRAVRRFVKQLKPWRTVSLHSPLNGVDTSTTKDPHLSRDLARWSGYPLRSFTCGQGCRGTMTQFINHRTPGAAVTFEFGSHTPQARLDRVVGAVLRVGTP